ncbi:energy-coupling factor transport system substrate-specific component [Granulicatella balaenopterae]|uniref:Energy-coupling factor transport system substrate-specific component n=1 Tax=Granulicatella balaenopterae TaxID=137733 RepID=A0A1H9IZC8_9LACT|nr:MptD family putative ECF transporter S component [Granulicatella balaenopterae]SEQ79896.1 energy-coupling factor transport system substrate-specific component [Granulicatella balaenopterae]
MKNQKLTVKDLINVGLFSVLIMLATFIAGMIGFIPVTMPIVPFLGGLVSGPLCMLFATKIKKPGMLFIEQMIIMVFFIISGHGIWGIPTALIAAYLAEVILKRGQYTSVKAARLAFSVASLANVGLWLPLYFAREAYINQLVEMGYGQEYADKLMSVLPMWSLVPIVLLGMLGMYIGCTIGIKLLRKHFVKAGMVEEV